MRASRRRKGVVSAKSLQGMTILATIIFVFGVVIAGFASLSAETANQAFSRPAPILATALFVSTLIELRGGLRNVVRLDIFMLMVLFLLTFLEFLFPQGDVSYKITLDAAKTSASAALLGFAGIAIGRLFFMERVPADKNATFSVSPQLVFGLLLFSTFFGYLNMLMSVNFNIGEMISQMMQPRFTQAWARGQLGGLSTLLGEVGLLRFLIAPLVGAMLAQASRYSIAQILIAVVLLAFVLFESFASGTRNMLLSNLMTFGTSYTLLMKKPTVLKALKLWVPLVIVSALSIQLMLSVRAIGLNGLMMAEAPIISSESSVSVDMNLINIALLTDAFPERYQFLGLEIPVNAAIRPIPRALWSGKPEGLSVSIEEAVGAGDFLTISATFVGEFWMAGGYPAVIIAALLLGAIAGWWNRIGARATTTAEMILFASAFYPAGIAMRSFMSVAPPMLPVIGLAVLLALLTRRQKASPARRRRPQT